MKDGVKRACAERELEFEEAMGAYLDWEVWICTTGYRIV